MVETGKFKEMYSEVLERDVVLIEYTDNSKYPLFTCSRCGKDLKRKFWVVQDAETDIIEMFLGTECIRHFR